jgi:TRAP-type C4-dicarboxylate transport system substrate-binding protein
MSITHTGLSRRALLASAASIPLVAILRRPAHAAEFELKYATGQDPTHPVNIRAQEALNRIQEATSGRINVKLFPANQLGSDTDLLAQVRRRQRRLLQSVIAHSCDLRALVRHDEPWLCLPGL